MLALKLPLQVGPRYRTNHEDHPEIVLTDPDDTPYASLYSEDLDLWFNPEDGRAWGTPYKVIGQLTPGLTLPPVIGQRYRYKLASTGDIYECRITRQGTHRGEDVFHSDGEHHTYTFWPDGEAKRNNDPPVAYLIEDVLPEQLEQIRNDHATMMARLKEIGAC